MQIEPVVMQAEATKRYLTDPEFHARVNITIQLAGWTSQHETGMQLSASGLGMVRQTAAYALLVAELALDNDFVDEAVESMKTEAEAMGFTVVLREAPAE